MKYETAVLMCCADKHRNPHWYRMADSAIIPNVMAAIAYCDAVSRSVRWGDEHMKRFAAAADKLRDFATVELLCADLAADKGLWRTPNCTSAHHNRCTANMCGCECHPVNGEGIR